MNCRVVATLLISLFLAGCSATGAFTPARVKTVNEEHQDPVPLIDFYGPDPLIARGRIEPINLMYMLDPNGKAKKGYAASGATRDWDKELTLDEKYEWAFHAFYDTQSAGETLELRRNRIQDRLLIASDQRCGIYKRMLYQVQSDANFLTGSLATVTGVLGSLFTDRGARNLSATSGIMSGLGAEFSQAYFSNLAANVITKGIEERRKAIYARMIKAQQGSVAAYSVQTAIKDAVFYDMQCSVVAGLEEAQDAIRLAAEPGMDAANRIIAKQKVTAKLVATDDIEQVKKLGEDFASLQSTSLLGGDRFSNVGLLVPSPPSRVPAFDPEFFNTLRIDPAVEEKRFRAAIAGKLAQTPDVAKDLSAQFGDTGTPPAPVGALADILELTGQFNTRLQVCTQKALTPFGTTVQEAMADTDPVSHDVKVISARASLQTLTYYRGLLDKQRSQIEGLRGRVLALPVANLFNNPIDGSVKDADSGNALPITLLSLAEIDAKVAKSQLAADKAKIDAELKKICP